MCHMESNLLTKTCFGTVKFQQPEKMGNQTSFQHSDQPNTRAAHYLIVSLFKAIFCRVIVKLAANSNKKN